MSINQPNVVNVNFDQTFKIQPEVTEKQEDVPAQEAVEEDETFSIKPLFLDTIKQVSTLEHDEVSEDQFADVDVIERPLLSKKESNITAQQMFLSQSGWSKPEAIND